MKKMLYIIALCGLAAAAFLTGCQKNESMAPNTSSPPSMSTNSTSTNAP